MKVKRIVTGPVGTNCYVVSNEKTGECFVVDVAERPEALCKYICESGLHVSAVLLTHGHFDHIMGLDSFLQQYPVPVYASEKEADVLQDPVKNASSGMYGVPYSFRDAVYVGDGQEISPAGLCVRVIHTPGHTEGGCCYYLPEEGALFSGDTLFRESIGRTDLPTGSGGTLIRSVREKLLCLPEETMVYPGHMEETDIGHEKRYNPFV